VQVQKENDTMKHTGLGTAAGYVSIVASVGTTENPLGEKKRADLIWKLLARKLWLGNFGSDKLWLGNFGSENHGLNSTILLAGVHLYAASLFQAVDQCPQRTRHPADPHFRIAELPLRPPPCSLLSQRVPVGGLSFCESSTLVLGFAPPHEDLPPICVCLPRCTPGVPMGFL
jgi:hypothetical protein